jgi:comEA protein
MRQHLAPLLQSDWTGTRPAAPHITCGLLDPAVRKRSGCAGPVLTLCMGHQVFQEHAMLTTLRTLMSIALVVLSLGVAAPSLTAATDQDAPTRQTPKPAPSDAPALNLNSATAAELEKLPGVGPATAARIVEYRTKNGAFKKVEDLMNVRGIGEKTFLSLKPLITVAPPKGENG